MFRWDPDLDKQVNEDLDAFRMSTQTCRGTPLIPTLNVHQQPSIFLPELILATYHPVSTIYSELSFNFKPSPEPVLKMRFQVITIAVTILTTSASATPVASQDTTSPKA